MPPLSISKPARDILLALAVSAVALLLQWALAPWIGHRMPFMVIEPAIVFTAATLGRLPATVVMLIGAANAIVAVPPAGQWLLNDPADRLAVAAYLAIGVLLIAFGGGLRLRSNRAERAERRLALAQDETGVGLFELDYRAGTAYASPALCRMLGQPVMDGSMPLQQWLDALNAGHVADTRRTLQEQVAAGELRYEREMQIALPDGSRRWLLSRIRLDLDARGELAASRGATLDITPRKQLLTELQAAQSQMRQQLDALQQLHSLGRRLLAMPSPDAALQATLEAVTALHATPFGVLWLCDPGAAPRLAAHCGLDADSLAQWVAPGMLPDALAHAGRHRVVADIAHDARLAVLRPLAKALGVRTLHGTPLVASGDGRVLGVLAVLTADDGADDGAPDEQRLRLTDLCAGQAAAVIEREQAVSLARDAQRRFEVALQSSKVAFTILAPVRNAAGAVVDFTWTDANPAAAALIDRPAQDLLGRRVLDVLPRAWDEPGLLQRYVQVSEHGCTDEFDTLSRRTSRPRWLHVILSPLNGSVVVWFSDVTQRRQQQQALQDADQRKDEFLATLAHELRNPLAPIRHAAAILRDPAASAAQRDWSLAVVDRQLQHMALLLDDLLDVSRITRGTLPLRRTRGALQPIVDTAVETSRPLFSERRHQLLIDLPAQPLWLDADPLRIAQVLGNLLINAAKYTAPGGRVHLRAHRDGGMVVLAVTDNGSGLDPKDCEHVFEMFTQLPAINGSLQSGLGIGLALARKLVQMHGGQLDAHSPGLGAGSTFTVRLPAADEAPLPPESPADAPDAAATAPAAPATAARWRILVADDNRDAADSLVLLLELDGHEVQVAYDGRQALAVYERFKPDVALLDMGMPGHSGAEVAALIRRQQQRPITLVAITGFGQQRDRRLALDAGFDHHLTKPVAVEQLQAVLAAIAQRAAV